MLTKDEIEKTELNPLLDVVFDYMIPISKDRILAANNSGMYLMTDNGDIVCFYDMIAIPQYVDLDQMKSDYEAEVIDVDTYLLAYSGNKVGIIDYNGEIIYPIEFRDIRFTSPNDIEVMPY